jgi:hypothetical protein
MFKISKFLICIVTLVLTQSCTKNNFAIDKETLVPPSYGEFNVTTTNVPVSLTDTGTSISFGTTNVATVDRNINLSYSSPTGAVLGTDFYAPTTAVIKAGKSIDQFIVKGNLTRFNSRNFDSVKVKITSGDVSPFVGKDSCWIILKKVCPVVLINLEGDYANTNEFGVNPYGPYLTSVSNLQLVPGSTTSATGELTNIYDDGWQNITFSIDWSNKTNFTFKISPQPTGNNDVSVRTSATKKSTFSSCDEEFYIYIDVFSTTTGAVTTANYPIVMKR